MWRLLSCFVCSSLIILILPSTSTLTYACNADEISCKIGILFPTKWCCSNTTTCGTTKGECNQITTPATTSTQSPSNTGSSIVTAIFGFVFLLIFCVFLGIGFSYAARNRVSRQNTGTYSSMPLIPQSQYPYQQQFVQQPQYSYQQQLGHLQSGVPSVNPSAYTNEARPIYNHDEQQPPSYESVSRDNRFRHPAPSAPMRYVP